MRLGRQAIALAPLDHALERLVQQLPSHHRQHDLAQHRHEHRHHVQPQHAELQQMVELFRPRLRIDIRRGDRMTARVGDDFGAALFVEIGPQVGVGGPDARYPFPGSAEGIEVRVFDRLPFKRLLGRQLLDADES